MKERPKLDLGLTGYDELFMNDAERKELRLPRIHDIPLAEIDPFPEHPFQVREDEDMENLVASVKERGVITPATVRQKEDGRYELISGHRRKRACELAGLDILRCEIVELDRDAATILMVDSNCQRSEILPSEKAFAYKMKLEAIKHQGQRTDLTSSQLGTKLRADEEVAQAAGESRNQVQRYIRLTSLAPELLEMVDGGRIALTPAVELSYLSQEEQRDLIETIESEDCTPSLPQARRMRKLSEEGCLDTDSIFSIMTEVKPNQVEYLKVPTQELRHYFKPDTTVKQMTETIMKAMDFYNKHLERQRRERDER